METVQDDSRGMGFCFLRRSSPGEGEFGGDGDLSV